MESGSEYVIVEEEGELSIDIGIVCEEKEENLKLYYQPRRGAEWRRLPKLPLDDLDEEEDGEQWRRVCYINMVFLLSPSSKRGFVLDLEQVSAGWQRIPDMPLTIETDDIILTAPGDGRIFVCGLCSGEAEDEAVDLVKQEGKDVGAATKGYVGEVYDIATETWKELPLNKEDSRLDFFLFRGRLLGVREPKDEFDDLLDQSEEFWTSVKLGKMIKDPNLVFDISARYVFDIGEWSIGEYDYVRDEIVGRFTCAEHSSLMKILTASSGNSISGLWVDVCGRKALVELHYLDVSTVVFEGTLDMEKMTVSWVEIPLPSNADSAEMVC